MSLKPSPANCTSYQGSCCLTCPEKGRRGRKWREGTTDGKKRNRDGFAHWILDPDTTYTTSLCVSVCVSLFLWLLSHFTYTHAHTNLLFCWMSRNSFVHAPWCAFKGTRHLHKLLGNTLTQSDNLFRLFWGGNCWLKSWNLWGFLSFCTFLNMEIKKK